MNIARMIKRAVNRMRGIASVHGILLPVDRNVLSPRMELTLASGKYEARERVLSTRIVHAGDVVLELGAGLGFVGSYLRKFTKAGKIICIEANPRLIPYINTVHELNSVENVEVLSGVVIPGYRQARTFPFYCRTDFWASSLDDAAPYDTVVHVRSLSFPEILEQHRPDVLIMDIEGGELDLLSAPSAGSIRAIVLETHPRVYGADGVRAVEANLARLGFVEDPHGADRVVRTFVRTPSAAAR